MPSVNTEYVLHASGLETTTASGVDVDVSKARGERRDGKGQDVRLYLDLTASATPTTLDVTVERKLRSGAYVEIAAFTQLGAVATGVESILIPTLGGIIRLRWVIVGGSYTFEVLADRP